MKLAGSSQRRLFNIFIVLLIAVASSNGLAGNRSSNSNIALAQTSAFEVKPVVVYPEAYAESLPASEVSPDLIKNGERKPVTSTAPQTAKGPTTQNKGDITDPTTEEYEFPMLPLPKGESAAGSLLPNAPESLQGFGPDSGTPQLEALQTLSMPAPLISFEGNSFQDNINAGFGQLSPPDTNGDVGPNHYVQMTNLLVRVWDKAGNPLTAPFKLSSLFTPLGGQCAAPDAGDPIVLYDPLADRWLLSQFAFASISSPPYHECIAISQTSDPTGAYHLYDFVTPGNEFPDYPKLGVWPDGYYMTTNQFLLGGNFDGAGAFAFDRAKMLAGDPTASLIYFNLNLASHPEAIGGMLPSDFDGSIAPPAGRPNIFSYFLATEFADAIDGLRLFDFHADFANPMNSTFTERPESPLPVAAFDPRSPSGRNDIQQPPPATNSNALDSISDRLMHRLQYRNFGGFESLVTTHTVNVSGGTTTATYRAGVRYYQLTSSPGGNFSVAEQGTYAPADGNSRWMGSAAVDAQGNLAVGFSVSSLTTFPSIRYAGRLATDPPGVLAQGEQEIIAGTGVQRSTGGRWGDYSALSVDPTDDCTFWFTTEYYSAASQAASTVGWLTRIGSFKFPSCTTGPTGTLQGTVTDALTALPVGGVAIQISNGFSTFTDAAGAYAQALAAGSYTITASKPGYLSASASVTVVEATTTIQDFALTPIPVMASDSSTLVSESFTPNGAIDPAETVGVSFSLKNIGFGATSNLVATLLPTGGVTSPSGPASYGVIAGNGGTGAQTFTFTADPTLACGSVLVATLHLQDGAMDLGDVTFSFHLGAISVLATEDFDGVTAPALPAGWTATVAAGLSTNNWRTVTTTPDSAPNAAFVPNTSTVHDVRLDSTVFAITSTSARLSFRNNYATEAGFDGGVLEISINGGSFVDILVAGGSFVKGGYNRTLSTGFSNPLPGRQAWSGSSGGYITTEVMLPASAAGANVQLRWRLGSDSSVGSTGWRIDSIHIESLYTCSYNIKPAGFALTYESFLPGNNVIDPGEAVSVDFSLRNFGSLATSNLTATLRNSGGVTGSSGTQTYGVVAGGGGTGTQSFDFRADSNLACGAVITATFDIYEGTTYLDSVSYSLPTGILVVSLAQDFDGVTAPALPAGWTATVAAGLSTNNWRTVTTTPDSAPNAAFVPDTSTVHDVRLDSTVFAITSTSARLSFRNNYATEAGFDGGVLEISINGGSFVDILAAGGSFVSGGYNRTLSTGFSNPLPGRQAWSGNSGGYITTEVNLPASASGANVQLRWRLGSDSSVGSTGWRIDSIQVLGGFTCDVNPAPAVTISPSAAQTVQYSDPISPVTISAVDSNRDLDFALSTKWNFNGGAFTAGLPSNLSTTDNGCTQAGNLATCTWSLSGSMLVAPGTYIVRVTVADALGAAASKDVTIIVTQEDARATYTGLMFTSTSCPTCSSATLTLAATIQDISVTPDAAGDTYPGDIRNAKVSFVNRDSNNALLCTANVGLVNANNLQTGTATCNYSVNLGSANSTTLNVGIIVNNWYTRNSSVDNTIVTVSKPLSTNFITGGGYLKLTDSAGLKAGDPGSKANFGFSIKYNKGGTNLQGGLNLMVRRTEADGVVHVYQVKSNSLNSLTVDPATGTASVTSKATIKDVTDPLAPVTLDGNATLQFKMDDNSDLGTADTFSATVWNKNGGLWFSSKWDGVKTIEQLLAGGNLIVR